MCNGYYCSKLICRFIWISCTHISVFSTFLIISFANFSIVIMTNRLCIMQPHMGGNPHGLNDVCTESPNSFKDTLRSFENGVFKKLFMELLQCLHGL